MQTQSPARLLLRRLEPYWYIIIPLVLVGAGMFIYHLQTGVTPGRVAFRIPGLGLEVYWYGIIITGGIALGSYVTSRLALHRAERTFEAEVPAQVRSTPLNRLKLPAELLEVLHKKKRHTLGDVLFAWGLDPAYLGLNRAGRKALLDKLENRPEVQANWLQDAPWRVWDPGHVWNGIVWCLILAVIGARLYHILTPSPSMAAVGIHSPLDYFRNPEQMLNLRAGGLGIYGGLAGGLLGLVIYSRRTRIPLLAWADLAAIGVALGQAIGRWANFFNQELYGRPTDAPWAITIEPAYRLPQVADFATFHPAFLYESLWNLLSFLVLLTLAQRYRHRLLDGDLMALYIIFYAIGRTLLELVRLDSRTVSGLGLPVATAVSLLLAALMAAWIYWRHRK